MLNSDEPQTYVSERYSGPDVRKEASDAFNVSHGTSMTTPKRNATIRRHARSDDGPVRGHEDRRTGVASPSKEVRELFPWVSAGSGVIRPGGEKRRDGRSRSHSMVIAGLKGSAAPALGWADSSAATIRTGRPNVCSRNSPAPAKTDISSSSTASSPSMIEGGSR